ncbi:MAG: ATP-binding protein [Pseudomonadota bacterium]|nr:ATP-binding protein [Pseudomonadota bacterium]
MTDRFFGEILDNRNPLITQAMASAVPRQKERFPSWQTLKVFFLYRLLLGMGLLGLFVFSPELLWTTASRPKLIIPILSFYSVLVLSSGLFLYLRRPGKDEQIQIAIFLDVVAFSLLLYAAGGVTTGFGVLLAIAVTVGALLMEGRIALLFASLASLGVLTEEIASQRYQPASTETFTEAGLLGITFFTVAILAQVLNKRIRDTERIAARRKVDIADLSKLNEFIIQHMSTGVVAVDGERRLRVLNAAAKKLLGTPNAGPGASLGEIAPVLAKWLTQHVAVSPEKEGTVLIAEKELRATLHLLGETRSSGSLIFLRDNEELVREAQQIKLASLGQLTASVAHNIRNPLSAISHAQQLVSESSDLEAGDRSLLEMIRRNADRIDEIIESILQLSRRRRMSAEPIELSAWLDEFSSDFRSARQVPEARFRLSLPTAFLEVHADPRHLHQILANLCDNALRHGGSEEIPAKIEIRAREEDAEKGVVIEVADEGPGIDPKLVKEIFDPFFTTSSSGTGLGLYIARELSEANAITLDYRAVDSRGSCFRLLFRSC